MQGIRWSRWAVAVLVALLLAGGEGGGQTPATPSDPCVAPIPPEMGADYDDNCWAYTPNSSGAMFTELWEKKIEVDCPVLDWTTGEIAPVVSCAKVGTSKTESASRPGEPDLKAGEIHCLFEADGYDCGNHDEPCDINPDTLATTWTIETEHQVQPKSGTGEEAQFTVTVPEDETGPIEFEVTFKVKGEGCYPELLADKGCVLEAEAGKVPVTVHPVRLIIKTSPATPLAGTVVNYWLGEGSLIPPGMEVTWAIPSITMDPSNCQFSQTDVHALSGTFVLPPSCSGALPIGISVCDVWEGASIAYECRDCSAQISAWRATYDQLNELKITLVEFNVALGEAYQAYGAALLNVMARFGMQFGSAGAGCAVPSLQSWQNAAEGLASASALLADKIADLAENGETNETELEMLNRAMQEAADLKAQLDELIAEYEEVVEEVNTLMGILPDQAAEVRSCVQAVDSMSLCDGTIEAILAATGEDPYGGQTTIYFCTMMSVNLPGFEMETDTCVYYYGQPIGN